MINKAKSIEARAITLQIIEKNPPEDLPAPLSPGWKGLFCGGTTLINLFGE